ncbi:MAG: hypothetical protein M3P51_09215 [Chloroflexota bacterium]|nr:hypothetical protein [Chloroflexota bacterium]
MTTQQLKEMVDGILGGVELHDDTIYGVVGEGKDHADVALVIGVEQLRGAIERRLVTPGYRRLRVMPMSRTVLVEWTREA